MVLLCAWHSCLLTCGAVDSCSLGGAVTVMVSASGLPSLSEPLPASSSLALQGHGSEIASLVAIAHTAGCSRMPRDVNYAPLHGQLWHWALARACSNTSKVGWHRQATHVMTCERAACSAQHAPSMRFNQDYIP
jgi:hypothetical protein